MITVFMILKLRFSEEELYLCFRLNVCTLAEVFFVSEKLDVSELFHRRFIAATNVACPCKRGNMIAETSFILRIVSPVEVLQI